MTGKTSVSAVIALTAAMLLHAGSAQAQQQQSYVSNAGHNTDPCTIAAPCDTLQRAHDNTNEGGQITVLDSGSFGALTVTKGVGIVAAPGAVPTVFVGSGNAITLNGTSPVAIVGLNIDGQNVANNGIINNTSPHVYVANCIIKNFVGAAPNGFGIKFNPSVASQLIVDHTVFFNDGAAATGGAILISPAAGGSAQGMIIDTTAAKGAFGIAVDGSGSTAGINVTMRDVRMAHNRQDGVIAVTSAGGAPIGVLVDGSTLVNNGGFGVRSIGTNVTIRVSKSNIAGNITGLGFVGGGALLSYGNNDVNANATDGTFSGPVAQK